MGNYLNRNSNFVHFQAHNFICVLEMNRAMTGCSWGKLVYPFEGEMVSFYNYEEQNKSNRIDWVVNYFAEQLTYYLNIYVDFEYYSGALEKYRDLWKIHNSNNLSKEDINEILVALATRFFFEEFGKVPAKEMRTSFFISLMNMMYLDEFKTAFAPKRSLSDLLEKSNLIKHPSLNNPTFRPELMDFQKQIN